MHHLQCHGPFPPFSMLPESPVVSSSPSSSCASVAQQSQPQPQPQPQPQRQPPRRNLKRRASQGSILKKPSSVSRFLSRTSGPGSRTLSVDSQLRLSATPSTPSSSPPSPNSSPVIWKGEYPSALPPTPPSEHDYHPEWNPKPGMLLLEPQINQVRGPGLDQPLDQGSNMDVNVNMNMNMENASRPPLTVDGLSSPSDQLSSAAASPGSTEMDVDYHTWLENGIDAASTFPLYFRSNRSC